jgi:hypothetical protein
MTALHPAQLWAARQRMVADDDGETWPEFLQRMALPRRD